MRRNTGKIAAGIALAVLLAGGVSGSPAAQTLVQEHGLSDQMPAERAGKPRSRFFSDDTVHAWARLSDASAGVRLVWRFHGPVGDTFESSAIVEGDGIYVGTLELDPLPAQDTIGDWSVALEVGGVTAYTDTFAVEPLAGLLWWGPFLGLAILLGFLAIVGYVTYRLARFLFRRRPA